jgi:hypothetical protein
MHRFRNIIEDSSSSLRPNKYFQVLHQLPCRLLQYQFIATTLVCRPRQVVKRHRVVGLILSRSNRRVEEADNMTC